MSAEANQDEQSFSPLESELEPSPSLIVHRGMGRKARIAATMGVSYVWSHTGYLLEIGAGQAAVHNYGVNPWVAAGTVAALTTAETLGASYGASKGIGEYTVNPKHENTKKVLKSAAHLSPLQSIWSGAPAGVTTDHLLGRDVTLQRRLVHSVPYGAFVGLWVTPVGTSIAETVVHTGLHEVDHHPVESSGVIASVALTALALKLRSRRHSRRA